MCVVFGRKCGGNLKLCRGFVCIFRLSCTACLCLFGKLATAVDSWLCAVLERVHWFVSRPLPSLETLALLAVGCVPQWEIWIG